MTPLERELSRQRAELLAIEQTRTAEVTRAYSGVASRLHQNLQRLVEQIERAERAGIEVRPGWLFAQQRYRQLISELAEHTDAFLVKATGIVTAGQREAVQRAVSDGRALARLALGPAPKAALIAVPGSWDRLPAPALDYLIGRASDRGPLGMLLNELAPLNVANVTETLAYGVAAGKSPRKLAREVQTRATVTRHRANVIARTEIVGAHRNAVTDTWTQTGAVTSWTWSCARDARTCGPCWAMDGTEHPVDEPLGSHPQCRCARVPKTKTWAEFGIFGVPDTAPRIPPAQDVFERLPKRDKLAILGRARLDAYNAGRITLQDLVRPTASRRWGPGIRTATLAETLG